MFSDEFLISILKFKYVWGFIRIIFLSELGLKGAQSCGDSVNFVYSVKSNRIWQYLCKNQCHLQ